MPFVYLLAHAPGDVEQLVLLGQRVFIQTWAESKKIRGRIPDHAGQWVMLGGEHRKDQDPSKALTAIVLSETGLNLDDPVVRKEYDIGAPKLHQMADKDYNPFTVIEYLFTMKGLQSFAAAINANLQKFAVMEGLYAKADLPRRTKAMQRLGPVSKPQSGWQNFIVKNFYNGQPPGPFNTEINTLTTQISMKSQQSAAWFELTIEDLVPAKPASGSPSPPPPPGPPHPKPPSPPLPPPEPAPRIIGLQVQGAVATAADQYIARFGGPTLQIEALFDRPLVNGLHPQVNWFGVTASAGRFAQLDLDQITPPGVPRNFRASTVDSLAGASVVIYPELTGIQINGAPSRVVAGRNHSIDYQAGAQATLRATLNPDVNDYDGNLNWDTGENGARQIAIDRFPIGADGDFTDHTVTLRVSDQDVAHRTVGTGIVPVVQALTYESNAFQDQNGAWYSYVLSNAFGLPNHMPAQARVTTQPDGLGSLAYLTWTHADAAGPTANRRLVYLNNAGQIDLQVRSDSAAPVTAALQVRNPRQWPAGTPQISLSQITFSGGRSVLQEDQANYGHDFGRVWQPGNIVPQTYTRNTDVGLQPEFTVTAAGNGTAIDVRATLFLSLRNGTIHRMVWTWNNIASANGVTADLTPAATNADDTLPDEVVFGDPVRILWEMRANGGNAGDWTLFDVSSHEIYVTYADPGAGYGLPNGDCLYWTVLKLSCQAANGQRGDPAALKAAIYSILGNAGAFDPNSGDNPYALRARDGAKLTYWTKQEDETSQFLENMLADASYQDAVHDNEERVSCACGCWADLLVAMFAAHGEETPRVVDARSNPAVCADAIAFMVSNWTFHAPPNGDPAGFSHTYGDPETNAQGTATWGPGLPGQNNPTPPDRFENHLIVYDTADGTIFYDPSYGSPTFDSTDAYVAAAAAGLVQGGNPPFGYSIADGAVTTILKMRIENGPDLN